MIFVVIVKYMTRIFIKKLNKYLEKIFISTYWFCCKKKCHDFYFHILYSEMYNSHCSRIVVKSNVYYSILFTSSVGFV